MRRIWKLVRVIATMLSHTLYLSLTVRRYPPEKRSVYRAYRQQVGTDKLCRILNVHVTLERELPESRGFLIVSNHIGLLDSLVLASKIPTSFVGKAEIRNWPFIGWVTREMGVLFVERERWTQTGEFIKAVRDRLRDGVHVLVFPEGTTGRGPEVRPFKTGAFAAVTGFQGGCILPVYLNPERVGGKPATGEVRHLVTWADNTQSFTRHVWQLLGLPCVEIQIRVGEPLEAEGLNRKELANRAYQQVSSLAVVSG